MVLPDVVLPDVVLPRELAAQQQANLWEPA